MLNKHCSIYFDLRIFILAASMLSAITATNSSHSLCRSWSLVIGFIISFLPGISMKSKLNVDHEVWNLSSFAYFLPMRPKWVYLNPSLNFKP